jgi:putative addiction module killer protein
MIEVRRYQTAEGVEPLTEWLDSLKDRQAYARIQMRFARLIAGNFGDCKALQDGVRELRIDWGPGYRVYYAIAGETVVLLLCGGDKRKQDADIARAVAYWKDFLDRSKPRK